MTHSHIQISRELDLSFSIILSMTDTINSTIPNTQDQWIIGENTIMISTNTSLDGFRLKNFYMTNVFQGFVWMIFHFSVVFFFTFQLKEVALVGIFLGIANLFSFFLDIPVWILQRYYSTKRLFIIAAFSQLIATAIFFSFIYHFFYVVGDISKIIVPKWFESIIWWFFGNALNWVLILIASFCYGLTKEINDISTYGYILSHASPSDYGKILSRNNITYGIGSLTWLLVSWVVLWINPTFAVIFLGVVIVWFLSFTIRFFDNSSETIEAKDIHSFTIAIRKINAENVHEYISEKINSVDLPKVLENTKYIFLKPKQKLQEQSMLKWWELLEETIKTGKFIWKIMSHRPMYIIIYWTTSLVLIFWFWDTFAATFLIDFLDSMKHWMGYVLLAFIAIPGLALQEIAIKTSEKIGIKTVAIFWLLLSWSSLIMMWIFAGPGHTGILLFFALINSLGYACGMALGQNQFLDYYNKVYAENMWLKEIDSNASAWPMKILQNLANVVWLILWWLILGVTWYRGFFIVFGILVLGAFILTLMKKDKIAL